MQGEGLDHRSSPRVKATSPEAREKNRRVEIGIVDTVIQIWKKCDECSICASQRDGPVFAQQDRPGLLDEVKQVACCMI